ncbi:hypothetical protein MIR68_003241 [Amoeboaphelidium protococcarum]|nr:hypothetical protein MIR68_003241 [Amoeboaphelidium protococcarum]
MFGSGGKNYAYAPVTTSSPQDNNHQMSIYYDDNNGNEFQSGGHDGSQQFRYSLQDRLDSCVGCLTQILDGVIDTMRTIDFEWLTWHLVIVYVCGIMFSTGWWVWIDGMISIGPSIPNLGVEDYICGFTNTLGLFLMSQVNKAMLSEGVVERGWLAKLCFFFGVVLIAGSLGGSITVMVVKYNGGSLGGSILVQNILIFVSSLLLWTCRNWEESF